MSDIEYTNSRVLVKQYLTALKNTRQNAAIVAFAYFCRRQAKGYAADAARYAADAADAAAAAAYAARYAADAARYAADAARYAADAARYAAAAAAAARLDQVKYLRRICPNGWEETSEFLLNTLPTIMDLTDNRLAILCPIPNESGCFPVLHVIDSHVYTRFDLNYCPKDLHFHWGDDQKSSCIPTDPDATSNNL